MILKSNVQGGEIKSISAIDDVNWAQLLGITPRQEDLAKIFATTDWLFRCATIVGGATSAIPMTIRRTGAEELLWDSDKDETMPPGLSQYSDVPDLMTQISASYALLGKAYCLRQRNGRRADVGLRWLAPSTIEPEISAKGLQAFKRHRPNGTPDRMRPDDILYFWFRDPLVEIGEPTAYPGAAAAQAAEIMLHLDRYLAAYFRRGMIKATLFVVKGNIPETERERVRAWWRRVTSGLRNAFTTEVIHGDTTEIQQIGDGLAELGNAELTAEKREAISTAFGIPHSLVMSNAANYATAEQDVLTLYQNTIIPWAKQIQIDINRQIFTPLGYSFRFEFKRIEAIQKSEVAKAQMIQQLTGTPVLTTNEGRALMGYEPIEGGDRIQGIKTPEEEAGEREMEYQRINAMREAAMMRANGQGPQVVQPNRREEEVKRLGDHIKSGAYLLRRFTSDVLTPADIEAAIIAAEWEGYP